MLVSVPFGDMTPPDARRVVGSSVHAKALHVTNKAECARRYGSKMNSKMLLGTVVGVTQSVTKRGRASTYVTCDFILAGDVKKRKMLNIRSVKPGPPIDAAHATHAGIATRASSENHPTAAAVSENDMSARAAASASENPTANSASENPPAASVNLMAAMATNPGTVVVEAASAENAHANDSSASTVTERSFRVASEIEASVQQYLDNFETGEMPGTGTSPTVQAETGMDESERARMEENQRAVLRLQRFFNSYQTTATATGATATGATATGAGAGAATAAVTAAAPPATATATVPTIRPVTEAHGLEWFADHQGSTRLPIMGVVPPRPWGVRSSVGDLSGPGSDLSGRRTRLDYFLLMFPPLQLREIVRLTNRNLLRRRKKRTTVGEIIKFFGVLILSTRFEFGTRASLWSNTPASKYTAAASFGKTGMSRQRFDDIWSCLSFSEQPDTRPNTMSSEQYRWLLVDGFVEKFNDYRKDYFIPSHTICVDESISRWYGQGGFWINIGLPMYMAIDRKPENGCEIQNAACGKSGVMLRLKLVKTAEEEGANIEEEDDGLLHGTVVLKHLVMPWAMTNRIVCADSYFASVGACEEMARIGLRFIGVVKTATRRFPQTYLSALELVERGDRCGLIAKDPDGIPKMLAFVWMDRNRRYFIANTSSLQEGAPYSRIRWRQVDTMANADASRVELTIPQPIACEIYYDTCAGIDRHNRMRQDDLMLERKLGTVDWSMRVNLSLFGMCVVDAWLVYSKCTEADEKQRQFYELLAEEMIDNQHDQVRTRGSLESATLVGSPELVTASGHLRSGISAHITPTKRKRKTKDGQNTRFMLQGRCVVCGMKTTQVCSECQDADAAEGDIVAHEPWICKPTTFRSCFATHMKDTHNM